MRFAAGDPVQARRNAGGLADDQSVGAKDILECSGGDVGHRRTGTGPRALRLRPSIRRRRHARISGDEPQRNGPGRARRRRRVPVGIAPRSCAISPIALAARLSGPTISPREPTSTNGRNGRRSISPSISPVRFSGKSSARLPSAGTPPRSSALSGFWTAISTLVRRSWRRPGFSAARTLRLPMSSSAICSIAISTSTSSAASAGAFAPITNSLWSAPPIASMS